jgi:hypothetical protein
MDWAIGRKPDQMISGQIWAGSSAEWVIRFTSAMSDLSPVIPCRLNRSMQHRR